MTSEMVPLTPKQSGGTTGSLDEVNLVGTHWDLAARTPPIQTAVVLEESPGRRLGPVLQERKDAEGVLRSDGHGGLLRVLGGTF